VFGIKNLFRNDILEFRIMKMIIKDKQFIGGTNDHSRGYAILKPSSTSHKIIKDAIKIYFSFPQVV
jgi:hypothetical protein